jgi:hypothetical protein
MATKEAFRPYHRRERPENRPEDARPLPLIKPFVILDISFQEIEQRLGRRNKVILVVGETQRLRGNSNARSDKSIFAPSSSDCCWGVIEPGCAVPLRFPFPPMDVNAC